MKKRFLILLGLCLCALLACGQDTAQTAVDPTAVPAATAAATPTASPIPLPTLEPTLAPVELQGQVFSADIETLEVPGEIESPDQLRDALSRLPRLRTVILDRAVPEGDIAGWSAAWTALEASFPDLSFTCRDLYQGAAAETVTAFAPQTVPDAGEMEAILKTFENLAQLDLGALTPDREQVAALAAQAPAVNVLWTDEAFGPSESAWETVTLSATAAVEDVKAYLACFPHLQEADLLAADLQEAEGDALSAAFPAVALRRMVTLNGKAFDSFTESIDLNGAWIEDYAAFAEAVGRFPKLRHLDLCECTLSNEELAALRSRYPEAGVVWLIRFGRWECRTDVVAFSTKQSGYTNFRLTSQMVSKLQYCTDLIALDLGHNGIDDLSWLEPLQNLQLLILSDNRIKDISVLASLKKLKYVELFMTPIRDITPLGELPELLDVNLCITYVTDLTPLLNCKKLERIWIGHQTQDYCSKESLQALLEAFPDAQYDLLSVSCTNRGWREHPRFDAYQEMFQKNIAVAPFLPED